MFDQIKNNIFTIHGLITTLIHVCLIVGAATCWITIQVQVLGNDPVAHFQSSDTKRR